MKGAGAGASANGGDSGRTRAEPRKITLRVPGQVPPRCKKKCAARRRRRAEFCAALVASRRFDLWAATVEVVVALERRGAKAKGAGEPRGNAVAAVDFEFWEMIESGARSSRRLRASR